MSPVGIGRRSKASVLAVGAATLVAAGIGGVAMAAPSFAQGGGLPVCGAHELVIPGGGGYPTARPNVPIHAYYLGHSAPSVQASWQNGGWQSVSVGQLQQMQLQGVYQVLGQNVSCQMPTPSMPVAPVKIPVPPTAQGFQLLAVQYQSQSFFGESQTTVNCSPPPPVETPLYPAIGGGLFALASGAGLYWLQRRRHGRRGQAPSPALGV